MLEINKIHHGDCLELMKDIKDNSVDMILCDLPYGTTACKWDIIIPFDNLWKQYKRIIKDNGVIILTASQPFTSILVNSNIKMFKYEWIWEKEKPSNFAIAKFQPLKYHENILCFAKGKSTYNPIMTKGNKNHSVGKGIRRKENQSNANIKKVITRMDGLKFPKSIIRINRESKPIHPTQKPLELFEYFIKTYTTEGDLILDNCIGSGTTAVACKRTNRNFIGIEKEQKYVDIAIKRLSQKTLMEINQCQEQ